MSVEMIKMFLFGMLSGFALIVVFCTCVCYVETIRKWLRKWFIGNPIIQWPALLLLCLLTKILRGKYIKIKVIDGESWIFLKGLQPGKNK